MGNLKVSCLINIEIENGKRKEILKWFNDELSSQEIEDLKQSEDLQTLERLLICITITGTNN
jgi:hypothetical protein